MSTHPDYNPSPTSGPSKSDRQAVRREHLLDAVSGQWEDGDNGRNVDDALEGREECPRYLTRNHIDGDDDTLTRFELDDTLDDVEETMTAGANATGSSYRWWPGALIDLDTGEDVSFDFKVELVVTIYRSADTVRAELVKVFRERLPSAVRLELRQGYSAGRLGREGRFGLVLRAVLDAEEHNIWTVRGVKMGARPLLPFHIDPLLVELTELGEDGQTIDVLDNAGAGASHGSRS